MGIIRTSSLFRPNLIGISLVALEDIMRRGAGIVLHLGSLDLMDGILVVDVKLHRKPPLLVTLLAISPAERQLRAQDHV